jgi:hypothetical protein
MRPRHSATERDRDVREALDEAVVGRTVVIERYTAQGLASAKIPINCTQRPAGVLLIDARLFFDQGGPLVLSPSLSFVWDSASKTAQTYEPGGMASNTVYRLTYLVIGG